MDKLVKLNLVVSAVMATLLVGCYGPLGPDNSSTSTIASKHSSEQTFRNLVRVLKDCFPDNMTIRSNFFPEAKEGEIDAFGVSEFGNIPFGTWTIKPAPSGATVTQVRSTRNPKVDAVLPEWIEGNSRQCPYGTRSDPRPPGSELNQNNMPVR